MLRGNNGQDIFFSDQDRCRLCLILQEGVERFGHRIHAFCFMTNHIHLVIQTGTISLSRIVQHLAMCYAIYINKTYDRVGHLFQGRFKAILVDANNYLPELVRYVHLNPVRAGIVNSPEKYFWSGHRAYLEITTILWLSQDWILNKFDQHEDSARKIYSAYIDKGIGKPILQELRLGTCEGRILGDDTFIQDLRIEQRSRSKPNSELTVNQLINIVAEMFEVSLDTLQSNAKRSPLALARAVAAWLAREHKQLSIEAVAKLLDKDSIALCKAATRVEVLSLHDPKLREIVDRVREKIDILCNKD